jgi:hypothetical protein
MSQHQRGNGGTLAGTVRARADAGTVRLGERDIGGLLLCGDMYGAPYDLLAAALDVRPDRLRAIVARWRRAPTSPICWAATSDFRFGTPS